ncbi:MAG: glycosyltransferase [bacterium]|nr:glycosyltransferase [bacterium]
MKKIKTMPVAVAGYETLMSEQIGAIWKSAEQLKGKRILHVNSTANGGGVAEILRSEVPLMQDLGIRAEWQVIEPEPDFFEITKKIHNALQGEQADLTDAEWERYEAASKQLGEELDPAAWDAVVVHDPQPAAIPFFHPDADATAWIWRCHLDSSKPLPAVQRRFVRYLKPYSGGIFSLEKFRLPSFAPDHSAIIPPAIDPLTEKNQPMTEAEARKLVGRCQVDPDRPFIVQVSRFDQWKDPLGVLEAWRLAKQQVPELQLVLIGGTADDDPQSPRILARLREEANDEDHGLCILADSADDRTVKAFLTLATVAIQKSLREGFGLTVTEALWAGTPVIGGNVGGITLQIENGVNGYLVSNVSEAAERIVELCRDPKRAKRFGEAGREIVREKFLLPRLVGDDLKLISAVLNGG